MAPPIRSTDSTNCPRYRARPRLSYPTKRRSGFTLAESLIASVVLAVAVVAVSGSIIASQSQTTAHEQDTLAISLGRALMEEAAALPLLTADTNGWPTHTDRSQYDRINDFNGYSDVVAVPLKQASSISDVSFSSAFPTVTVVTSGTPALASNEYQRTVSVTYPTSLFGTTVTSGDFALISITVRGRSGTTETLSRLVANNTLTR